MKKYKVNIHYNTVLTVIAKNEKEALQFTSAKTSQIRSSLNESGIVSEDSYVISVEEIQNGIFTVNESGKKVKFAPGNLYWDGEKFAFEKKQYDYPNKRNPKHVGHFFWNKDAAVAIAKRYKDDEETTTGKFFAADGGAIKGWTVLSIDEWEYLINHSLAKNSRGEYDFIIAGKTCAILLPDELQSLTLQDTYSEVEWAEVESDYGLVALPSAGYRCGSNIYGTDDYSDYWSSTPLKGYRSDACHASFYSSGPFADDHARAYGFSVRLVSVQ